LISSRTAVESKSNRSCNRRITRAPWHAELSENNNLAVLQPHGVQHVLTIDGDQDTAVESPAVRQYAVGRYQPRRQALPLRHVVDVRVLVDEQLQRSGCLQLNEPRTRRKTVLDRLTQSSTTTIKAVY